MNYGKYFVLDNEKHDDHPTIKPLEIIAAEVQISSSRGALVLDLFGGSGSTLIACEQTDRTCFMMELDPKYVDVIIARWEKLTGLTAELVEG
jgi:DNA modification methylase